MSIRVNQYLLLKLEDAGKYGVKLIEGWEDKGGNFRPCFCKREFKKDSGEKVSPVAIKLGDDKEAAQRNLLLLLAELGTKQDESDVPF